MFSVDLLCDLVHASPIPIHASRCQYCPVCNSLCLLVLVQLDHCRLSRVGVFVGSWTKFLSLLTGRVNTVSDEVSNYGKSSQSQGCPSLLESPFSPTNPIALKLPPTLHRKPHFPALMFNSLTTLDEDYDHQAHSLKIVLNKYQFHLSISATETEKSAV